MSYEEGALCEPLSVGIWACERAGLEPGDRVLVTGAGPVGLLAAQAARAFGAASVTVADIADFRLGDGPRTGLRGRSAQARVPTTISTCSWNAPAPRTRSAEGLWRLRDARTRAIVGMPKQDVTLALPARREELTLGLVNRYAHTWPLADRVRRERPGRCRLAGHPPLPLDETADAILLAKHVPTR